MSDGLAAPSIAPKVDAARSRINSPYVVGATIVALTIVAAGLRFYRLSEVELNAFYDSAVLSMGKSWHNFFFAAFEPGGSVAVDKPPLELWLQVISTKLFGFNSFALKLPETLSGLSLIHI